MNRTMWRLMMRRFEWVAPGGAALRGVCGLPAAVLAHSHRGGHQVLAELLVGLLLQQLVEVAPQAGAEDQVHAGVVRLAGGQQSHHALAPAGRNVPRAEPQCVLFICAAIPERKQVCMRGAPGRLAGPQQPNLAVDALELVRLERGLAVRLDDHWRGGCEVPGRHHGAVPGKRGKRQCCGASACTACRPAGQREPQQQRKGAERELLQTRGAHLPCCSTTRSVKFASKLEAPASCMSITDARHAPAARSTDGRCAASLHARHTAARRVLTLAAACLRAERPCTTQALRQRAEAGFAPPRRAHRTRCSTHMCCVARWQ